MESIKVKVIINENVEKVWDYWISPEHIVKWNAASEDWCTTKAVNDLRVGGEFTSRMEAKDGSFGFDFFGTYNEVKLHELISYTLGDGRDVKIRFNTKGRETEIIQIFEAETENAIELQEQGWQAILDSFKRYTESN